MNRERFLSDPQTLSLPFDEGKETEGYVTGTPHRKTRGWLQDPRLYKTGDRAMYALFTGQGYKLHGTCIEPGQ